MNIQNMNIKIFNIDSGEGRLLEKFMEVFQVFWQEFRISLETGWKASKELGCRMERLRY